MDQRAVFTHVVESGIRSIWNVKDVSLCGMSPCNCGEANSTIIFLWWFYHVIVLGGYWIHVTCEVK